MDEAERSSARIAEAVELAARLHRGQVDKGGAAYILHPLRVMMRVEGEDCRIAAALHDAVEDCGLALEEVRRRFGPVVADAVDALTRREGESYANFVERCGANEVARAVKLADLADNMDLTRLPDVGPEDRERLAKYKDAANSLVRIGGDPASIQT